MVFKKSSPKEPEEDAFPETDVSKEFLNFLVDELKNIYSAEKHLVKAFPKMHKAAVAADLKHLFASHLAATRIQAERLEQVFELLGETPRVKKCEAMDGLLEEINGVIEKTGKGSPLRDTGLIIASQKIENYEISTYEALILLVKTLGNEDILSLLEETLSEEKQAEELLNIYAESSMNEIKVDNDKTTSAKDAEEPTAVYDSINLTGKTKK